MSAQFVDLGRATFTLTKAKLQLEMKACALLRPETNGSSGLTPTQIVEQRSSYRDSWICKDPHLHFSFSFSIDDGVPIAAENKDRCLDHLGRELEAAQLWSQLCLRPSLSVQEPINLDITFPGRDFVLALNDENAESPCSSVISSERNSQQIDVANLKAPGRVPTLNLLSVKISLHFSLAAPIRPRQCGKAINSELSPKFKNLFSDGLAHAQWPFAATIHFPERSRTRTTTTEIFDAQELCYDKQNVEEDGRFEDFESLFLREVSPGKAADSIEESRESCFQRYREAASKLTDAAFRNLICARPIRIMPGIKPSANDSLSHLTNLAPVIFIPGYAETMKARSAYIPAIAKVLSRFLDQPQTANQRKQRESLLSCGVGTTEAGQLEFTGEDWPKKELEEVLTGHLWMTLANGVRNGEAARKLKPLHTSRVGGAANFATTAFEDLLCLGIMAGCPATVNRDSSIEEEFDSLFPGDEDEEFATTEDEHFSDLYDEALSLSAREAVQRQGHLSEVHFDCIIEDAAPDMAVASNPSQATRLGEDFTGLAYIGESIFVTTGNDRQGAVDSAGSHIDETLLAPYCNRDTRSAIGGWPGSDECGIRPYPHDLFESVEDHHTHMASSTLQISQETDYHLAISDTLNRELLTVIPEVKREIFSTSQHCHQTSTDQSILDIDTEMPAYERSNQSSLSDILGGDHLSWHMWSRRRPSLDPVEDMLELHAMYERDPDMRLLSPQKTNGDENGDMYMLDSEASTNASNSTATSPSTTHEAFFYGPDPVMEQRNQKRPSTSSTKSSPSSSSPSSSGVGTGPAPRRKLSLAQGFLKRLSIGKSSVDEPSAPSRPFSSDGPRDVDIKRRKTLADYEASLDGEEMLMT